VPGRLIPATVIHMRPEGDLRVSWTRPELIALKEAIEVTPNFEGRQDVREILKAALHAPRMRDVTFERDLAQRFANRLVPVDMPTAMARAKLLTAVRGRPRREHRRPASMPSMASVGAPAAAAAA
jgi:hypothetical protein